MQWYSSCHGCLQGSDASARDMLPSGSSHLWLSCKLSFARAECSQPHMLVGPHYEASVSQDCAWAAALGMRSLEWAWA